jgi:hypothetical protein
MQLTFLGKSYTATFPVIEATKTQETINFLGRSSLVKTFTVTQRQQPKEDLTFMGRHYTR